MIAGLMGAPWVPAYQRDVDAILDDLKLQPGQTFVELGCGDGRLVAAAAARGVTAIGYEINPLMWAIAVWRCRKQHNARIRLANLWQADLSDADAVMAFLMPKFMERIETGVLPRLKPGARLLTYVFALPTSQPTVARHHWNVYRSPRRT